MAYSYGKKPSFGSKLKNAFRKVAIWGAVLAGPATWGYYNYGTVKHETVKVDTVDMSSDSTSYTLHTDKGTFNVERARLHFQSVADVQSMMKNVKAGETYDVTSYGMHIGAGWQPNVYKIKLVTADELKKRGDKTPANNNAPVTTSTTPVTAPAGLSGQTVTTSVTVNGYVVEITIPVEAAGKVSINSVKPVVATNENTAGGNNFTTTPTNDSTVTTAPVNKAPIVKTPGM